MNQPHSPSLLRNLGTKDAVALVIGTVIGTGVFLKTAGMAQQAGSPFWVLAAWAVAGALSFAGALTYAELGAMYPRAGGEYVYLREGYGSLVGFLYGWMRFWIGSPGSIAAYGVGAATFLGGLLPLGEHRTLVAILLIAFFSLVNCFSVAFGGRVQTFMTAIKVFMIVGLTFALFGARGEWRHFSGGGGFTGWTSFGAAVLAALWAFDGWNNLPMAAGEIRDPGKVLPRALGLGMLAILFIYAAANMAYFYVLPFSEILASSSRLYPDALPVATRAAEFSFGSGAVAFLSIAFVFSSIGAMNGSVLTSARVPYAMAKDGLFFSKLGEVSKRTHVPVLSVVVQGIWACVLASSGTFDQLTDYVVFSSWIFYALATGALFILRKRLPHHERPFRTPGYPWFPMVFLVCSVLLLFNTVLSTPRESLIGLAFIVAGIPVYFLFQRKSNY